MTATNEAMRKTLREIEGIATNALANQPNDAEHNGRHLNKALGLIELKAHVVRWGQEGYPAPKKTSGEIASAGRGIPSTAKRGSESGLQPPSREAVAQEGTCSNTG